MSYQDDVKQAEQVAKSLIEKRFTLAKTLGNLLKISGCGVSVVNVDGRIKGHSEPAAYPTVVCDDINLLESVLAKMGYTPDRDYPDDYSKNGFGELRMERFKGGRHGVKVLLGTTERYLSIDLLTDMDNFLRSINMKFDLEKVGRTTLDTKGKEKEIIEYLKSRSDIEVLNDHFHRWKGIWVILNSVHRLYCTTIIK